MREALNLLLFILVASGFASCANNKNDDILNRLIDDCRDYRITRIRGDLYHCAMVERGIAYSGDGGGR